jgi:hypothetical protein
LISFNKEDQSPLDVKKEEKKIEKMLEYVNRRIEKR